MVLDLIQVDFIPLSNASGFGNHGIIFGEQNSSSIHANDKKQDVDVTTRK